MPAEPGSLVFAPVVRRGRVRSPRRQRPWFWRLTLAEVARQAIPRPPWARRIDPSPFPPGTGGPHLELTIGAVRDAFAGVEIPASPDAVSAGGEGTGAAVLVVLAPSPGAPVAESCEPDTQASVVLIRRAGHLRANPGEIAFPGGRIEAGESPLAAALREAEEEVALPARAVEVLGELPVVHASRRSVPVLPFVAVAGDLALVRANPAEVDGVLVVSLAELVAPGRYWREQWDQGDDPAWTMHFFDLGEDVIWGATARMLYELFLRLVSPACDGRTDAPPGGRTPRSSRRTTKAS